MSGEQVFRKVKRKRGITYNLSFDRLKDDKVYVIVHPIKEKCIHFIGNDGDMTHMPESMVLIEAMPTDEITDGTTVFLGSLAKQPEFEKMLKKALLNDANARAVEVFECEVDREGDYDRVTSVDFLYGILIC